MLDLYCCLRPVRWFKGVPSPVKDPAKVDMTIFRENTEDIYAGIEFAGRHGRCEEVRRAAEGEFPGALQEGALSGDIGLRHQAGLARRHRTARARGAEIRGRQRPQER